MHPRPQGLLLLTFSEAPVLVWVIARVAKLGLEGWCWHNLIICVAVALPMVCDTVFSRCQLVILSLSAAVYTQLIARIYALLCRTVAIDVPYG